VLQIPKAHFVYNLLIRLQLDSFALFFRLLAFLIFDDVCLLYLLFICLGRAFDCSSVY